MPDREAVDLLIVGGGINGAGIARDAAGRGRSVLLCEQNDLASGTSSASTKLIHGGLRYLENYDFRLVRESLIEREVLLRNAPHIIRPLTFVLPHDHGLRPTWTIRAGLFLYDHLGGRRRLPRSRAVDLRRHPAGAPLKASFRKGFTYADCWVDDARLVVLNALDAHERGARILPGTRCLGARRVEGVWEAALQPTRGGATQVVRARALVNAAGPWVADLLGRIEGMRPRRAPRLVKGSHIVVPRLWDGAEAYILQNVDQRVVFVIPYEGAFSLIGTTEIAYAGDPAKASIAADEIDYLCAAVNRYFDKPVRPSDVVSTYAGVRPLYDDASETLSALTRDYIFDIDAPADGAPLLSIYGGKITTYRKLAENALDRLLPRIGVRGGLAWTDRAPLPGGDMPGEDFAGFLAELQASHPWLPAGLALRYARAYGTRVVALLGRARALADLGEHFGGGLYEAEVDYMMRREWARGAEDILWRRSKLGLHLDAAAKARLSAWLGEQAAAGERAIMR